MLKRSNSPFLAVGLLIALATGAQPPDLAPSTGAIRNWGISLRDGPSGRIQVRFSSSEAIPDKATQGGLIPSTWDVSNLRLETFRPDERQDFIIESPRCRVNISSRDASSTGPFTARREADGLSVSGVGFLFENAHQRLIVSNDVRIQIRSSLVQTKSPAK